MNEENKTPREESSEANKEEQLGAEAYISEYKKAIAIEATAVTSLNTSQ